MSRPAAVSAQDYTEIQGLYAYYNLSSDAGDADGYAACFAHDGELSIPTLSMHIRGRDALHAFKVADKGRRGDRIRRHWNSGLCLETIDERTIRGRCYLHGYDGVPGAAPELTDIGGYEDTLVREEGEWRFAKRVISLDHTRFTPPTS